MTVTVVALVEIVPGLALDPVTELGDAEACKNPKMTHEVPFQRRAF